MAWTREGDAITADVVEDTGSGLSSLGKASVALTSTSTILADRTGVHYPPPRFMFGVMSDQVGDDVTAGWGAAKDNQLPFDADSAIVGIWGNVYSQNVEVHLWVPFIVSTLGDWTFFLRNHLGSESYSPILETRVPFYRTVYKLRSYDADFDFYSVAYNPGAFYGDVVFNSDDAVEAADTFQIVYKDPFVLEIPSGDAQGWWMLVSRYRVIAPSTSSPPSTGLSDAVGDLVAFYSPTPDFRTDAVVGPFRLVACTNCITIDGTSTGAIVENMRFWIGTAGAAVVTAAMSGDVEDALYVYYTVEKCTAYLSAVDRSGNAIDSETNLDWMLEDLYAFQPGVWLRRIPLTELASALAAPGDHTDEAIWRDFACPDGRAAAEPIVGGTVVGRIRVWEVADYNVGKGDIETEYQDAAGASVMWADPAPSVSSDVLALFLAAIQPSDLARYSGTPAEMVAVLSHLGAWSAVAVDPGSASTFGLDFTLRLPDDQIATGGDKTFYIDPDPVLSLDEASVWVYIGSQVKATDQTYSVYANDATEVFRDWSRP